MSKHDRGSQRGFTLIVVIMLVAVMAMMAVSLINLIRVDLMLVGQSRRNAAAREIAEGGLMEVINDQDLPNLYPNIGDANLIRTYTPPAASVFTAASGDRYDATVSLLRIAPMGESSQGLTRAVVYEVAVTSNYRNGESSAEVRAEIYRPVSWAAGAILPSNHYR